MIKLDIQKFAGSTFEFGPDGVLQGRIIWSSTSNGSVANSSNVTATLQAHRTDSYTTTGTWTGSLNINGDNRSFSWYGSISNSWVSVSSFTITVGHNNDGTKSCYIGGSVKGPSGTSLSSRTSSGSQNVTLDTIPRASQPSINTSPTNSPNFNIGDTITIYMNKKANFTHKVYFVYGNTSLLVAEDVVDSCTFDTSTIANDLYALIPNSNTYSNVVSVQTYNGSTLIGTATCNYNAKVINANPIFSNFEYEDTNATTLALTGDDSVNVNGYSTIKATISTINKATAQKGATMSKYMLTIGDKSIDIPYSSSESVFGSIQNAPNGTYNLYAIDSRGNTTLVTKLASQNVAYTPITFNSSSCKVERNNGGVGGYAVLTLSGNVWNANFGQVQNTITSVVYQYKKTSDTSWQTGQTTITPTILENKFEFEGQVASNNPDYQFELNSSYDFRVIVNDKLSTKSIQLTPMGSAVPNISLADEGVGIMCDYDESLGGELQIGGRILDGLERYSENETMVGYWINDKPIYRKVYTGTDSNNSDHAITEDIITAQSIDIVTSINCYAKDNNGRRVSQYYYASNDYFNIWVETDSKLHFRCGSNCPTRPITYYVILEYTKTTD